MGRVGICALDRIERLEVTEKTFKMPKDFVPEAYFTN